MNTQTVDSLNSRGYSLRTAAKSAVGCRNPEFTSAHDRATSGFFMRKALPHLRIMVGRAGQPQGWPGFSDVTGFLPLHVSPPTTVGSLGGELSILTSEAATMATIPNQAQPKETLKKIGKITVALRNMRTLELATKANNNTLCEFRELLKAERAALIAAVIPDVHRVLGITPGGAHEH